uniref:Uncharacterized protein n=1 Tax=Cucumis melo TaxID=3656 RepID=A0A9I9EDY0_CUCME
MISNHNLPKDWESKTEHRFYPWAHRKTPKQKQKSSFMSRDVWTVSSCALHSQSSDGYDDFVLCIFQAKKFYIKAVEAELPILPSEITAVCGLNNQQFIRQAFLAQILQLAIHHFRAGWLPPFASAYRSEQASTVFAARQNGFCHSLVVQLQPKPSGVLLA